MNWRIVLVMVVGVTLGAATAGTWAQSPATPAVEGIWRLKAYKGGGNEGPASGQLILHGGHFGTVYTMNEDRPRGEGRAHAGTYSVPDRDTLVFSFGWDVQFVNGAGTVSRTPSESRTKLTLDGKTLTITFPNGAYQTLERVAAR